MIEPTLVCGYVVVRKPDENFEYERKAPYFMPSHPPQVEDKYYLGIERLPWYELEEGQFSNKLPVEMQRIYSELREENQPCLDIKLMKDLGAAKEVLTFSNSRQSRYEIVALHSAGLKATKGCFEASVNMTRLGFDVAVTGYGSLLMAGIFRCPEAFVGFEDTLNRYGLFEQANEVLEEYCDRYRSVEAEFRLEPILGLSQQLFDIVSVFRPTLLKALP